MNPGDDAAIGQRLGGYHIEEVLGRGGMGVVYRAVQPRLRRSVALKVITPALAHDTTFRERFERESALAASIEHPHVLPVYEAGEDGGCLYLAVRFVDGTDLAAVLRRSGPLHPTRAVRLLQQIGSALDAAHGAGLVHRDVKPANVLVTGDPEVEHSYLTDFGLTKRSGSQTGLTATGQWVGTLDYVAPEQIRGDPVDARADVYALGCLLYELLTGQPPYARDNDAATMWAHLSDPPPAPSAADPSLPPALDGVVARALAKDPAARYPTAGGLAAAATTAVTDFAAALPSTWEAAPRPMLIPAERRATEMLPTGTVTLMSTDIDGWAQILATLGTHYADAVDDHRRILRSAIGAVGGVEVDCRGDTFLVAFARADAAVAAAVTIQRSLGQHQRPRDAALRVRIGLHTGTPTSNGEGYVGIDLRRTTRVCAAAHGGQVVLSQATREALDSAAIDGVTLRPLGAYLIKDLDQPLSLYDLQIDGLDCAFPPPRSIGSRPTNLPSEKPELIGREADLEAARTLMLNSPGRLVTFTGPGGTGKTTLALRVAADLLSEHRDGAFVVLLASVASADMVAAAAADALGLRERVGRSHPRVLADYLAERELLLVFDNFEHVIDASPLIAELLSAAPRLRILVTSRSPLRLNGEHEFAVTPLALTSSSTDDRPAAVELFVRRARSARPTSPFDEDSAHAIAEICARLDGLPLAIELAAARARIMTPQAMLLRLRRPFELASGGPRHVPARQQTLHAAIAWSYDLLSDDEQRTFARLSVFAGPFTIEAAEYVCEASLDDLAGLLDHSLLRSLEGDRSTGRLRMLETIRAYAREQLLASGHLDLVCQRHADWCLDLARAATPQLLSDAFAQLQSRFDAEQDDLRGALAWLVESGRGDAAVQLAAGLAIFWDTRGQLSEGRAHLERALAAAQAPDPWIRAVALFSLGRLAMMQSDTERATASLTEALSQFREAVDPRGVAMCLGHLGATRVFHSDGRDDALRLNTEALTVARASGDPFPTAFALNDLALALWKDAPDRCRELLEEGVALARKFGVTHALALLLLNSGELALSDGRTGSAGPLLDEALSLAVDLNLDMIVTDVKMNLARTVIDNDVDRARTLLEGALDECERFGDPFHHAVCLYGLVRLAAATGNAADARRFRESAEQIVAATGVALEPFDRWERRTNP